MAEPFASVTYPIPIYLVASRYFVYNIDHVTDLRARYRIAGILFGTLPSHPAQNVFLGLPLQLMPEEARLLVENNLAYVIDDGPAHKTELKGMTSERRKQICGSYELLGKARADEIASIANAKKLASLAKLERKQQGSRNTISNNVSNSEPIRPVNSSGNDNPLTPHASTPLTPDTTTLFFTPTAPPSTPPQPFKTQHTTPTTSQALFVTTPTPITNPPPASPTTYPLYSHLHAHTNGYYLSPGLRFGCHFLVYPGDPLRFHSHFLANAYAWHEEIALLDLVGGGRLGTGVKKGFLVGGKVEGVEGEVAGASASAVTSKGKAMAMGKDEVRCFCIEWAGM